MGTRDHWQHIYSTRRADQVGWFEPDPSVSRKLVMAAVEAGATSVIDVGGGASSLVDQLLDAGVERVAVLDLSEAGIDVARRRLGERAARVEWIVADATTQDDVGTFDVWHDRAVFHFLIEPAARRHYVALSRHTVRAGGAAVMATFASDGPERCSGLPVQRYDPEELALECGAGWQLERSERKVHITPRGVEQRFAYSSFVRVA